VRAGFAAEERCPAGGWCAEGSYRACPPGTFGNASGPEALNASVCEACAAGFLCPRFGAVDGDAEPCGGADVYCPEGSAAAIAVDAGFYSVFGKANDSDRTYNVARGDRTRNYSVGQAPCGPGTYCDGGLARACPAGRYGDAAMETDPRCAGPCAAGRYCAEPRRTRPEGAPCGDATVFCPLGSTAPQPVRDGWYAVGGAGDAVRVAEARCEPGGYCASGARELCGAGTFNPAYGATSAAACGNATPGYYVPSRGAVRGDAVPCGGDALLCPDAGMVAPRAAKGRFNVAST